MTAHPTDQAAAFAALDRHLAMRRLAQLDTRSRVVVVALAVLVSGFFFWQVRVPLDGHIRAHGAASGALWLAAGLGAIALAAGSTASWRQGVLLDRLPGPEWLALPVEPARVMRHLLSESRVPALGAVPPAIAVLLAGVGLMPAWWLALLAAAFAVAWLECTRIATALVRLGAAHAARGRHPARDESFPAALRLLAGTRRIERAPARATATWRREPAWRALRRLDRALATRVDAERSRLAFVGLMLLIGLLAWFSGAPPELSRAQAFAAFMPACALLGAWAILRTCGDPPGAHRPLPLGMRDVWRARFTVIAAVVLAAAVINAAIAHGLPASARVGLVVSWFACGVAVATLGLHYGITLQPRANAAENLYYGWLGIMLISSWTIPLLGWGFLIAGMVHSTMRLPRWWRPEVD